MNKYCVLLFLCIFCGSSFSLDFNKLDSVVLTVPEIPNATSDHYIKPNEFLNNTYGNILTKKQGGTLISVGTLRSFILFGLSRSDHGLFVDADKLVVAYNKAILNLMLSLSKTGLNTKKQRYLFLSLLSFEWLSIDELSILESSSEALLVSQVASRPKSILSEQLLCMPVLIRNAMQEFMAVAEECLGTKYSLDANDLFSNFFFDFNLVLEDYFRHRICEDDYKFFFEDDSQWEYILDAINNNKIALVHSDISNVDNLKEISSYLKSLNTQITWIDISNIAENDLDVKYLTPASRENFIHKVIPSLPFANDAQLLFTHQRKPRHLPKDCIFHGREKMGTDGLSPWHYYSLPIKNILALQEVP